MQPLNTARLEYWLWIQSYATIRQAVPQLAVIVPHARR